MGWWHCNVLHGISMNNTPTPFKGLNFQFWKGWWGLFRELFNFCNFQFSKGGWGVYLTKIHNENFFHWKRWKMTWISLISPNFSWKTMKNMMKSTNFTKFFTKNMKNYMNFIKKREKKMDFWNIKWQILLIWKWKNP